MRLKKVPICLDNGKIKLEIPGDHMNLSLCIVYSGGQAKLAVLPAHGETRVVTHQGKIKRIKFDEGEEF